MKHDIIPPFSIVPFVGYGPFRFGMSSAEIATVSSSAPITDTQLIEGTETFESFETYPELDIQLVYNSEDSLSLIELMELSSPIFMDVDIFGTHFSEVMNGLRNCGITFTQPFDRSMYLSLDKGVGLYVPYQNKIESFSLFCRGYYDANL
ncbi:hypothetical protein Pla110_04580 [Polystyrenella longa]|uniref:Uncharacterized protein n=1 Tax=Polystyrenella longa TaxID=2528007 RepID=A0A518CHV4_9PLAN|nr:hypothetical protein [Polystyrenella longa]QDU78754.1 hypothetical protein Pla110_04580 [Polystyrenella longa]